MKSWKATRSIGMVVFAMLVLTVMDHAGLAESNWGTWREVDWNIRASDLDWNILGNDSFHGTYISNRSGQRVDIKWNWKNKLLNAQSKTVRIQELEGMLTLYPDENFAREGWLNTPNDGLDPGTYRIRASVEIELNSLGARQRYSVRETSGTFVVVE